MRNTCFLNYIYSDDTIFYMISFGIKKPLHSSIIATTLLLTGLNSAHAQSGNLNQQERIMVASGIYGVIFYYERCTGKKATQRKKDAADERAEAFGISNQEAAMGSFLMLATIEEKYPDGKRPPKDVCSHNIATYNRW